MRFLGETVGGVCWRCGHVWAFGGWFGGRVGKFGAGGQYDPLRGLHAERAWDDMGLTIGVDIGGTKILAGVVDADGGILDRLKVATPKDAEETARVIGETVAA